MAQPIIRGTKSPLQQRFTEHWSPQTGYVRQVDWRGLDIGQLSQYAYLYAQAGCEYELTSEFGVGSLHILDTAGQFTVDTWEIGLNKLSPSSLQNPINIANISSDDLITIGKVQIGNMSYEDGKSALAGHAGALRLLDRMNLGSVSFYKSGYVLRHTTNVSNRYRVNISDVNVDFIYTTAQLLSETLNANSWIFPLPGRLAFKIQNIPAPDARADYLWGWLKSGGAESSSANNRVNIVTEYELDQWSIDEYFTV